ncbi:suppressor protein SRP40 isoform X1 [Bradysia coprophila]|uniref:suppressor protein SRP40 isoform X1 n=1 Tax=Bradysia coprophila TaxID=38358 RepID=UPI00187DCDC8|nr:suppressor protein SRP40 isoform X1 [Bradysia coprophila]
MKNIVVVLLVTIVSLVSSKPIEEQLAPSDDLINNVHNLRPRRQLPDEITLNKQFFENIFQSSRISRDTSDGEAVPTIALHDLISSVEHTLIHSAQNLALSNITANLTATNADSSDSNNTSNVEQIVLPISVPTPTSSSPQPEELATESEGLTTVTEEDLIRDLRSNDESGSGHIETEYESVKPIEHSNLGILFPISLNPSANISHVVVAEESNDAPVTEPTIPADPSNITILHTINATQTVPTAESDVVHVQQQQITFFSANAGVFPNIHALNAADLPSISQTLQTTPTVDCSGEETSDESTDSSSEEDSSSDSSSEEKEKTKKSGCTVKSSSVASSKPTESSTPSEEEIKKLKTDELKEQIAEVEADPVILTQGI